MYNQEPSFGSVSIWNYILCCPTPRPVVSMIFFLNYEISNWLGLLTSFAKAAILENQIRKTPLNLSWLLCLKNVFATNNSLQDATLIFVVYSLLEQCPLQHHPESQIWLSFNLTHHLLYLRYPHTFYWQNAISVQSQSTKINASCMIV